MITVKRYLIDKNCLLRVHHQKVNETTAAFKATDRSCKVIMCAMHITVYCGLTCDLIFMYATGNNSIAGIWTYSMSHAGIFVVCVALVECACFNCSVTSANRKEVTAGFICVDWTKYLSLDATLKYSSQQNFRGQRQGLHAQRKGPWASEGFSPGGALGDFSKTFPGLGQKWSNLFSPLKAKKTTCFA